MSDDDDTGHHHSKVRAFLSEPLVGTKFKVWHAVVAAIALIALGAWLF